MLNFRQFEAGPDPAGKTWQVLLKWMQTAIALRHSDTVDARFILQSGDERVEKTIAMPHSDLLEVARRNNRPLTDPWCSRLAALHLARIVTTGEDMEKDPITVPREQLEAHAAELQ